MDLDEVLLVDRCRDTDEQINFWARSDYSPDPGTGFLSPIAYALQRGNVEFYYVGENLIHVLVWGPVEAATREFEASKHRCRG